ncbi:prepilin peptidase [Planosporangium mesophilum]|uniref:Prepilin type IV endopeptidase peptidase domain-containing protein n=1 Tax=Planosporangium mesophilum TaxID=689768 RepID=A0A8J3TJ20_9ACTN|nr:A24 family peptidase [Planosporangium mesophilum]NJC82269.1 prepilin peptidase [Planosporangium mesophilum]GII22320.1 hypothetical protein Pme01_19170 [Planosporangium mesophilum]
MLRVLLAAATGAAAGPLLRTWVSAYARPPATGLVSAIAAGVFALLAWRIPAVPALAAFGWVGCVGIVAGFVDAALHRLPDRLTGLAFTGALVLLAADALAGGRAGALGRAVLSGAALAAFYAALVVANPVGMGAGDAKLALSLGTVLGWLGPTVTFLGALTGLALASVYAMILLASRRISRGDHLAHGPFMLLGALFAIVVRDS